MYNTAMKEKIVENLRERLERDFLPYVRQPGRYIGGEVNQIRKDIASCDLSFALCFPDIYEVGMSHTGFAIIYDVLNKLDSVCAERVFSPWTDAEEILRKEKIKLFSLESKSAVKDFDVIGFSLTNELCYTNVLNMLDLAGLAIRSDDRTEDDPIVIAGGGMSNCCEPMADFIDMFLLGEGEESIVEMAKLLIKLKNQGKNKSEILLELAKKFEYVYVPRFYEFEYDGDQIKSFKSKVADLRTKFKNAVVENLDQSAVPEKPIVPFVQAVHERVSVEIMRGCPGRCRFCQASYCRRPIRFRSVDKVCQIAKQQYHATGFDTVSLLSLSSADYPHLEELVEKLQDYFNDRYVGISLPSLKVAQQLKLLPKLVSSVRKTGLTMAVEAASEKLRKVINKPITDEDLLAGAKAAYKEGFCKIKLYFMVGFPGETEDDIKSIVDLSYKIATARKEIDGKTANINAAVSWLVPKAHTPFGWMGQKPVEYFQNARRIILNRKDQLRAKFINFKFHTIEQSVLESAFGRGDRRLGDTIESAWRKGAKFDLWRECFNYQIWQEAFEENGISINQLAQREFKESDILPWQHLGGPGKKYLRDHFDNAMQIAIE